MARFHNITRIGQVVPNFTNVGVRDLFFLDTLDLDSFTANSDNDITALSLVADKQLHRVETDFNTTSITIDNTSARLEFTVAGLTDEIENKLKHIDRIRNLVCFAVLQNHKVLVLGLVVDKTRPFFRYKVGALEVLKDQKTGARSESNTSLVNAMTRTYTFQNRDTVFWKGTYQTLKLAANEGTYDPNYEDITDNSNLVIDSSSVGNNYIVGTGDWSNLTGSNNFVLGLEAGESITSGSGNVVVGNGIDVLDGTADDYLNLFGVITGNRSTGDIALPFLDTGTDAGIVAYDADNKLIKSSVIVRQYLPFPDSYVTKINDVLRLPGIDTPPFEIGESGVVVHNGGYITSSSAMNLAEIAGGNIGLGIGGTPLAPLHVFSNIQNTIRVASTTTEARIVLEASNTTSTPIVSATGNNLRFRCTGNFQFFTGSTFNMQLLSSGQLALGQYGAGTFTGTIATIPALASNGRLFEVGIQDLLALVPEYATNVAASAVLNVGETYYNTITQTYTKVI